MHLGGHRKINNYKEYFLEKLSCGISRVRCLKKLRLREPLHLSQETWPSRNHETYTDSIPLSETSTEHDLYLFSIETSLNNKYLNTFKFKFMSSSHNKTMWSWSTIFSIVFIFVIHMWVSITICFVLLHVSSHWATKTINQGGDIPMY